MEMAQIVPDATEQWKYRCELVVELVWSVIPWLILVGAVTPAVIGIIHDSKASPVQPGILEPGGN
jgi:hypothetical protein